MQLVVIHVATQQFMQLTAIHLYELSLCDMN